MHAQLDRIHKKLAAISYRVDELPQAGRFYGSTPAPTPAYAVGQVIQIYKPADHSGLHYPITIGPCTFIPLDGGTHVVRGVTLVAPFDCHGRHLVGVGVGDSHVSGNLTQMPPSDIHQHNCGYDVEGTPDLFVSNTFASIAYVPGPMTAQPTEGSVPVLAPKKATQSSLQGADSDIFRDTLSGQWRSNQGVFGVTGNP